MEQRYTNKALTTPDSIRILKLEPGVCDEPLQGSLVTGDGFEGSYHAISYVWGNPNRNHTISTPEGCVPITSNLSIVLQRVRSPKEVRCIWADAVCINQDDVFERGHQVKSWHASTPRPKTSLCGWAPIQNDEQRRHAL